MLSLFCLVQVYLIFQVLHYGAMCPKYAGVLSLYDMIQDKEPICVANLKEIGYMY